MSEEAFVTLATNDSYAVGCLVLANSLKQCGTSKQLAVMVTTGVSHDMTQQLRQTFDYVKEVALMDSSDDQHLKLLGRPDLGVTITKIKCWLMTKYKKCVFLDADTLVLQCIDELFLRDELSAAPDVGWPDCFNSGVFVYKPSEETYEALEQLALTSGSFDGGDQGLLNMYFRDWSYVDIGRHLPFTYNVVSHAFYSYLPAYMRYRGDVKVVHFIGATKPWHQIYDPDNRHLTIRTGSEHNREFLEYWWNMFRISVLPHLSAHLRDFIFKLPFEDRHYSSGEPSIHRKAAQDNYLNQQRPFTSIQERLDVRMVTGTGGKVVDQSKSPFPAFSSSKGTYYVDIGLMTNEHFITDSSTQVCHREILQETGYSRRESYVKRGLLKKTVVSDVVDTKPVVPKSPQRTQTAPDNDGELRKVCTQVDVKNPNRIHTLVSADKDANAKFKIKSLNSAKACEEFFPKQLTTSTNNDAVKMLFEFKCNYLPNGKNTVTKSYY